MGTAATSSTSTPPPSSNPLDRLSNGTSGGSVLPVAELVEAPACALTGCSENLDAILEIVSRAPAQSGFHVLPQHWGVERTFACFGRYRRLSKDDKKLTKSSEATSYLASIHTWH
jgi:putative transposase